MVLGTFLTIVFTVIGVLLILSFLVLIHELGHFLMARRHQVAVEEFGLGYPPRARKLFRYWNTDFTLNWVPFGGFVRLEGEDVPLDQRPSESQPNAFYAQSKFARLSILLAGATVNLLFAILAFAIVFSFRGIPTSITTARIGEITPGSPAEESGIPANVDIIALQAGEVVYSVSSIEEIQTAVEETRGQEVILVTTGECDGLRCPEMAQYFPVYVRLPDEIGPNEGAIGVIFAQEVLAYYPWYEMPFRGVAAGVTQAFRLSAITVQALGNMVFQLGTEGKAPEELSGPIGIVHQTYEFEILKQGPLPILHFMGLLSMSLAIFNILPIPGLDGGRSLFIFLEPIFGRQRLEKFESYVHFGGYIFLLVLIVLISFQDIWKIIT